LGAGLGKNHDTTMMTLLLTALLLAQSAPVLGVSVKGRVVPPAGTTIGTNPPPQVSILGGRSPQRTILAADGSFSFSGIPPGSYVVAIAFIASPQAVAQPVTFTVGEKDVDGIELVLLRTTSVSSRVVVEGGGLRPQFSLSIANLKGGSSQLSLGPFPGGAGAINLPEGDYRLSWGSFPAGYFVKSITSGSTDLLANPLKVSVTPPPEPIIVTLGVSSPPPWVKVSGKVINAPRGSQLVLIGTYGVENVNVTPYPDGTFEIPMILPGAYQARITPAVAVPPVAVVIPSKDVADLEIVLPAMREISGRVTVEGGASRLLYLSFLALTPGMSAVSINAVADTDGRFKVSMPEGERRVSLNVAGYEVKSLTFGEIDLLKDPMKVAATNTEELKVTLTGSGIQGGVPAGTLPPLPPLPGRN
jgi:hypothetical protein